MSLLMVLPLAEMPVHEIPAAHEINGLGQALVGLGLGGTMIAGFVIVIGMAIFGFLFLNWSLRKNQ